MTPRSTAAALPGLAAKWLAGKPFVFEVRDLWPELPRALGVRNPFLLGGMSVLEWLAYHAADTCIGLAPGIVAGIAARAPAGQTITLIPNGSDLELFHPRLRAPLTLPGLQPGDFVAGFTGAHGPANGLTALLAVAQELQRRRDQRVKLVFIGDGKEKDALRQAARQAGLTNCFFYDPVPKEQLGALTASLDCGLMVLKNIPAFYAGTSPNKFFDYAAAGIPIINNYPGWLAECITATGAGIVVPPDDPSAFADALQALAADPARCQAAGRAARALAVQRFARADLADRFVTTLETVAAQQL